MKQAPSELKWGIASYLGLGSILSLAGWWEVSTDLDLEGSMTY
jgi:hypothetical protein